MTQKQIPIPPYPLAEEINRGSFIMLTRREFLRLTVASLLGVAGIDMLSGCGGGDNAPANLRIALLHLAPVRGDVAYNRTLIEFAMLEAARHGAAWVITPELATTGYYFAELIGTDWIEPQPDAWMRQLGRLTAQLGMTVFIGTPERDPVSRHLYNSVFAIGPAGTVLGRHRKIKVIPGSEDWSTPGTEATPIPTAPLTAGILICADAYTSEPALGLRAQGAQILVSSAAWTPGEMGPNGAWENRSRETGLPFIVCNRTGGEPKIDFSAAESAAVNEGQRQITVHAPRSTLVLVDLNLVTLDFTLRDTLEL